MSGQPEGMTIIFREATVENGTPNAHTDTSPEANDEYWRRVVMAEEKSFFEEFWQYRASKGAVIGCCVLSTFVTVLAGFTWGGWVTHGSSVRALRQSAELARRDLATTICVAKFLREENAADELQSLKRVAFWRRGQIIIDGGWSALPGVSKGISGVADKCAQRLAEMSVASGAQSSAGADGTQPGTDDPTQLQ